MSRKENRLHQRVPYCGPARISWEDERGLTRFAYAKSRYPIRAPLVATPPDIGEWTRSPELKFILAAIKSHGPRTVFGPGTAIKCLVVARLRVRSVQ